MPVQTSYPGVYIQELPSGVRTITGVATSITAFIGRAARGEVNTAVTINSFADYDRLFGGLWVDSAMSFAVRDFYMNGGSQAIIVRLATAAAKAARLQLTSAAGNVTLDAASVGTWGDKLTATIDRYKSPSEDSIANAAAAAISTAATPVAKGDLFHLTVTDTVTGTTETFRNLTTIESVRRVDKVLAANSRLVRWAGPALPVASPAWTVPLKDDTAALTKGHDGAALSSTEFELASPGNKRGLYALEQADLFNLLVIPPYTAAGDVDTTVITAAEKYCYDRRAIYLIDAPTSWTTKDTAKSNLASLGSSATYGKNSAVFFPRQRQPNPFHDHLVETFAASGAIAGVFSRTDSQRGVWKAPAGLDASVVGASELSVGLTDAENGELNPLGINCLRTFPAAGRVVWGARTLQGDDRLASEWKYIPVRRTALFIEETVFRGTKWAVFEPNDEPLWSQLRLNIGAFMQSLFTQGAFQGRTPKEAYFVKCDKETTTQTDINNGIVNILIGFAPLKPAEFVIISLQQMAGQAAA